MLLTVTTANKFLLFFTFTYVLKFHLTHLTKEHDVEICQSLPGKSYLEETMALKKFVVPDIQFGHFVETFPLLDAIMHIQNDNYQEINFLSIRFTVGNLRKINQNQKASWDCNPRSTHSLYMK